ncbi:unnamed protein product [Urochloa humidicola]
MSTPPPRHHPHLYLVLEGSEDEYSIHKIDVHDFDPDDDTDDLNSRARPLPDPPLLRVEGARNSATLLETTIVLSVENRQKNVKYRQKNCLELV